MMWTFPSARGSITRNKSFCLKFLLTLKMPAGALHAAHLQPDSCLVPMKALPSPLSFWVSPRAIDTSEFSRLTLLCPALLTLILLTSSGNCFHRKCNQSSLFYLYKLGKVVIAFRKNTEACTSPFFFHTAMLCSKYFLSFLQLQQSPAKLFSNSHPHIPSNDTHLVLTSYLDKDFHTCCMYCI